jgi:hypothetical protein
VRPFQSETINFTDYQSARLTPASYPRSQANMIIWTFGGRPCRISRRPTISPLPTLLQKTSGARGIGRVSKTSELDHFKVRWSWSSFPICSRRRCRNEQPSVAIFYDGFNDAYHAYAFGAGAMQRDLSDKVAMLVEGSSGELAIYAMSSWLAGYSKAWASFVHPRIQARMFAGPLRGASEANLEKAISVYAANVEMRIPFAIVSTSAVFFLLQPLVVTKAPLGAAEQAAIAELGGTVVQFVRAFYAGARTRLGPKNNSIDLSDTLKGREVDDFYDLWHTGALTSPVIGNAIAERVLRRTMSGADN